MESNLEELGLSKGEVKVYLALFDLKEGTKYSIAKQAEVSASKVYEILDKLIKKGLVSTILRNKVQHFLPANPAKLKEYVDAKREKITKEAELVSRLLPQLTAKLASTEEKTKVELYEGVEGMRSILSTLKQELDPTQEWVAMGIRSSKKTVFNTIVTHFHQTRAEKKVPARMLFVDEGSKFQKILKRMPKTQVRVLNQITPAGVAVYRNRIGIFYYGEKPSCIFITNEGIAQSFRAFFDSLSKIAQPV